MNQLIIQNPEKLAGEIWTGKKGNQKLNLIYEGRNLKLGVDNYLWSIYSFPIGEWMGYLQINKEIYQPNDALRSRDGKKIPNPPYPHQPPTDERRVIDVWIQMGGVWRLLIKGVNEMSDIKVVKNWIGECID